MSYPPFLPVIPLGKYLFHPLHNYRQLPPSFRFNIKGQPIIRKTEAPNSEGETAGRFAEHPDKNRPGLTAAEEGFPVVDAGTDFVPHARFQFT
jgi:hypothetical protein